MIFRSLALFFFIGFTSIVFGQGDVEIARPKIGVVLSGGGAKGISHVGVLKAMEKAGIRPDYITGTSMGAVIGGLYAIGYSADTLEKIIKNIDWDQVLSNKIPLNYISYEEKFYYDRYLINFPIDINKFKIMIPNGLIEGQMLSELLSDFTWPAAKYQNFDEFPIPFRCIATDVSTGKPYIFKEGPLSKAMRSSMAIPTAFTSVDVDSTLFVDGGIVNNFPVELVRAMGADIVIGINVSSTGFDNAKDINNIPGILMQMSMISSLEKLPEQIKECTIYIEPELAGYSTASFSSYEEILKVGDEAGDKFFPEFEKMAKKYHLVDTNYLGLAIKPEPIIIDGVILIGNKRTPNYVIRGKLNINEGDIVTQEDLENGIRSVFGLNNFNKVVYYIHKEEINNEYTLTIDMDEKMPATLLSSFHFDNTFSAGIILNFTLKNILLKGSRSIFLADISENPKFRLDYLKYLGRHQHFALEATYDYQDLEIPTYEKGEIKDYGNSTLNNFKLQAITTNSLFYSFGIGYEYTNIVEKSKFSFNVPEGINKAKLQYNNILLSYYRDSMNDRNFPTRGILTEVILKTTFSSNYSLKYDSGVETIQFPIDSANGIPYDPPVYIPVTESELNEYVEGFEPSYFFQLYFNNAIISKFSTKFQILPKISFGITISDEDTLNIFDEFRIGGVQRINITDTRVYGLNYGELYSANFGLLGLTFQNVVFKSLYIQYGVNVLSYYDYVPIDNLSYINWNTLFGENTMFGYGLVLKYKSLIGPISLGVSRNTQDSYYRFYFQLGYSFNYTD